MEKSPKWGTRRIDKRFARWLSKGHDSPVPRSYHQSFNLAIMEGFFAYNRRADDGRYDLTPKGRKMFRKLTATPQEPRHAAE